MSDDRQGGASDARSGDPDEVGSVGEEAAKLFGAFSDWARDHGGESAHDAAQAAAHGFSSLGDQGSSECRWCPVCRTAHAVRQASPEVREHLAVAAASLMQAAAGVLAAASQPPGGTGSGGSAGVEHIDLDDSGDEDEPR